MSEKKDACLVKETKQKYRLNDTIFMKYKLIYTANDFLLGKKYELPGSAGTLGTVILIVMSVLWNVIKGYILNLCPSLHQLYLNKAIKT